MPDFLTTLRSQLANVVRAAPDGFVIEPGSTEDTALVLRLANEYRARLSPPGADASEDRILVDLSRMTSVLGYDEHAHVLHAEAGMSVAALSDELRRRGRTLPLRHDVLAESLGGFLARGAPGTRSKDDDPVEQLVSGITVVLADGRILDVRPAPRRAVGPDLVGAIVGARGRLGIITEAHLVTRARRPTRDVHFLFPSRESAEIALAQMRGRGVRPEGADVKDAPEGAALSVQLSGEGALLEVPLALVESIAKSERGVEVSEREVPPSPAPVTRPLARSVVELASALDPRGVLSAP